MLTPANFTLVVGTEELEDVAAEVVVTSVVVEVPLLVATPWYIVNMGYDRNTSGHLHDVPGRHCE